MSVEQRANIKFCLKLGKTADYELPTHGVDGYVFLHSVYIQQQHLIWQ
jgi:hypothetical protein